LVEIPISSHKFYLNYYKQSHISLKLLKFTNETPNSIKSTKISNEIDLILSNSLKSYEHNHVSFTFAQTVT
jgi:hypothetical protein